MKPKILFFVLVAAMTFSCSSDKESDTENNEPNTIIGTWDATQLKTEDPDAIIQSGILDYLTEKECYVLTLRFNQDLSVVAESAVQDLQVETTENGFVIPCPEEKSTETSTYTYDDKILSIQELNGQPVNAPVTIDGNRMELDAKDLEIPDFDYTGKLIFRKR